MSVAAMETSAAAPKMFTSLERVKSCSRSVYVSPICCLEKKIRRDTTGTRVKRTYDRTVYTKEQITLASTSAPEKTTM